MVEGGLEGAEELEGALGGGYELEEELEIFEFELVLAAVVSGVDLDGGLNDGLPAKLEILFQTVLVLFFTVVLGDGFGEVGEFGLELADLELLLDVGGFGGVELGVTGCLLLLQLRYLVPVGLVFLHCAFVVLLEGVVLC